MNIKIKIPVILLFCVACIASGIAGNLPLTVSFGMVFIGLQINNR